MNRKLTLGTSTVEQLKHFQGTCPEGPLLDMLARIVEAPQVYTNTDSILGEFRTTLNKCKKYTVLEKEALCTSLETVMEILRMEGSDGMLDNYLHGILL
jgi:hypothetical protein